MTRGRLAPLTALVTAGVLLVASFVLIAAGPDRDWSGPWGRWRSDSGSAVADLDGAERAAAAFAADLGLVVGEVMEFENGFYAVLTEPSGTPATEVLVDPARGSAWIEHGPAMRWNTEYGSHMAAWADPAASDPDGATALADQWLAAERPGERAAEVTAFPGYCTVLAEDGTGAPTRLLSVRDGTGEVWPHSWLGGFVARTGTD